MCEVTTAILAVASTAYGLYRQEEAAEQNEAFIRKQRKEQQDQAREAAGAEATDRARQARQERARLRAMQAESGLAGITMDTLLQDRDFALGRDLSRIDMSLDNQQASSRLRAQGNMNRIEQPDYVGAMLNTGLSLYQMGAQQGTVGSTSSASTSTSSGPSTGWG